MSENMPLSKMDDVDKKTLYNTAWRHWGSESQLDMAIEEMAEFTQAILKARRNGVTYSYAFSEEMADVIICLEQISGRLKQMPYDHNSNFSRNLWDQVTEIKERKLQRLKTRLLEDMGRRCPEGAIPLELRS